MVFQNLVVIQLVHAVTGRDHNVRLMAFLQEIQILVDGVRGSSVPVAVGGGDGGGEYKQTTLLPAKIPPLGGTEMFIQRSRVVLCQHGYLLNMRVGHIAEREIDAPVASRNRHGRNGSLMRQFSHSVVISAC